MGSRANAARAAGVSEDMLYRYMREDSLPSFAAMVGLAHAAGASLEWLATGTGAMLRDNAKPGPEFVMVPHYGVEAGGESSVAVVPKPGLGTCAFRRDWLLKKGLPPDDLAVIQIAGDSMSPTIRDGALGLVDRRQRSATENGIYILLLDNRLVAKRLQSDFSGGLYVRSDNPAIREHRLTADQITSLKIFGRLIWIGGEV